MQGSVDGSGILAIITFSAIGSGDSYIRIQDIGIYDPNGNEIPVTVVDGSVAVRASPPWDVNTDGRIDIVDIILIGQSFGDDTTTEPNPADVNGDGIVDIADIVLVGQHFGEVYSSEAPPRNVWSIEPQYLPVLIKLYNIMSDNSSTDPSFLATKRLLHRFILNVKTCETKAFQNYPNPFNPETWIPYQLAEDMDITIRIYQVSGKLIRTLDLGHRRAGFYTDRTKAAYWDGRNESGEPVASGVYFYTIQAGEFTATKKMIVAR